MTGYITGFHAEEDDHHTERLEAHARAVDSLENKTFTLEKKVHVSMRDRQAATARITHDFDLETQVRRVHDNQKLCRFSALSDLMPHGNGLWNGREQGALPNKRRRYWAQVGNKG